MSGQSFDADAFGITRWFVTDKGTYVFVGAHLDRAVFVAGITELLDVVCTEHPAFDRGREVTIELLERLPDEHLHVWGTVDDDGWIRMIADGWGNKITGATPGAVPITAFEN